MTVFIINILFIKTKVFVVNWFQWHKKLQNLFRGTLYNKKRGVPLWHSITTLNIIAINIERYYAESHLCSMSFMLSVANKTSMLCHYT